MLSAGKNPHFRLVRFGCGRLQRYLVPLILVAVSVTSVFGQFDPGKLAQIDAAIEKAIAGGKTPGGVLWLESRGQVYSKAFGHRSVDPEELPARLDTIYDAASITKVAATAPAIMKLVEQGKVIIDAPVSEYLPEFSAVAGDAITVRHLMTHTSGLSPGLSLRDPWSGIDAAYELACSQKLRAQPGERFIYSDINYILLGILVQKVSGLPLEEFCRVYFYAPLGMSDTGYNPPRPKLERIAPTQRLSDGMLHGVVHDPTARRMGGVAGHAGLFFTASDLARYARMILGFGSLDGTRVLQASTVRQMVRVHSPGRLDSYRALGWDVDTGYTRLRGKQFSIGGVGHTGFTGPSLWIDFETGSIAIFLCNRVHPDGKGNVLDLREEIGTLFAESLPLSALPGPPSWPGKVMTGIDVLVDESFAPIEGLRIGLITNHTGHDRNRESTIELLRRSEEVELKALFSPEHGIAGTYDAKVEDSTDETTSLPVFSLYGETRKPLPEQLEGLDALVFDIQDIGCRFYTYISTMGLAMQAAAENNLKFVVLDRPNPINGVNMDGPILQGETDFVGFHTIPIRHGMTVGELAGMFRSEMEGLSELDLHVVTCRGWTRDMFWSDTGLPWTNPSPNMRSSNQALLYPGVGVIEVASISVGRGTDTPFEIVGAPYINDVELAREINRLEIRGISAEPITFTPESSKFANQQCFGVRFTITDRKNPEVLKLGVALASILHRLHPSDFGLEKVNRLLKSEDLISMIRKGHSIETLAGSWEEPLMNFAGRRAAFLLY